MIGRPAGRPVGRGPPSVCLRAASAPVLALAFNEAARAVVSADARGLIEYWSAEPEGGDGPDAGGASGGGGGGGGKSGGGYGAALSSGAGGAVRFSFKSETDLYALAKVRRAALSSAALMRKTHRTAETAGIALRLLIKSFDGLREALAGVERLVSAAVVRSGC